MEKFHFERSNIVLLISQIRFTDRNTPPNKIKGKEPKVAKKIFHLAAGNHEMYRRRRMPDPLEVQQMKVNNIITDFRGFLVHFP